jgi:hypothetical protein
MIKFLSTMLIFTIIFLSIGLREVYSLSKFKTATATQKIELCSFYNFCSNITISPFYSKLNLIRSDFFQIIIPKKIILIAFFKQAICKVLNCAKRRMIVFVVLAYFKAAAFIRAFFGEC